MFLTLAAALLGSYLGMNSRSRLTAALVSAALVGATYVVLVFGASFLINWTDNPQGARALFDAIGVGQGLWPAMGTGAAAALVAGIILSLREYKEPDGYYLPGTRDYHPTRKRKSRRPRPATPPSGDAAARINDIING